MHNILRQLEVDLTFRFMSNKCNKVNFVIVLRPKTRLMKAVPTKDDPDLLTATTAINHSNFSGIAVITPNTYVIV